MKGCGYCQKAKKMFASELASGEMVQKDASDAPDGVRGFPTFKSNKTGKMHSGLPKSKADLHQKLGHVSESYYYRGQGNNPYQYNAMVGTPSPAGN